MKQWILSFLAAIKKVFDTQISGPVFNIPTEIIYHRPFKMQSSGFGSFPVKRKLDIWTGKEIEYRSVGFLTGKNPKVFRGRILKIDKCDIALVKVTSELDLTVLYYDVDHQMKQSRRQTKYFIRKNCWKSIDDVLIHNTAYTGTRWKQTSELYDDRFGFKNKN